jgi:hypothetical protein
MPIATSAGNTLNHRCLMMLSPGGIIGSSILSFRDAGGMQVWILSRPQVRTAWNVDRGSWIVIR